MDYLEYLGRRLVWLVVSLVVVIVVKRPRLLKGLALVSDEVIGVINYYIFLTIAWLVLVTYFILYLFTVVTFFLSWHSLTLNNVMEMILQTVFIIPTLYTLFVPHTRLSRELMNSYQRKKNKSRAATATYNHSLNYLKICKKVT
ncbi:hypothetical protein [Streptococcus salivarius]|uniref:hypothetical protein n=1 Tax=Streptococcus salivarius TaxID=1304 RepID=UPI00066CAC99|nr:hypothetical protein [Streptococcus salivarius]